MKLKSDLIRINGTEPGRGSYVCNNPECIGKLLKNKKLDAALKEALQDFEGTR